MSDLGGRGEHRAMAGEEVVQLYVTDLEASAPVPIRSLQGCSGSSSEPGESDGRSPSPSPPGSSPSSTRMGAGGGAGLFEVSVGGKQPGFSGLADAATTGVVTGGSVVVRNRYP